ncbi:MAG: hypothetical protein ABIQ95_09505 [Bdellovibrionia bacterium]
MLKRYLAYMILLESLLGGVGPHQGLLFAGMRPPSAPKGMSEQLRLNTNTLKNMNNPAYKGLSFSEKKEIERVHGDPEKWGKYSQELNNLRAQKQQYKQQLKQTNLTPEEKQKLKSQFQESKQRIKAYNQGMRQKLGDLLKTGKKAAGDKRAQDLKNYEDWRTRKITTSELNERYGERSRSPSAPMKK